MPFCCSSNIIFKHVYSFELSKPLWNSGDRVIFNSNDRLLLSAELRKKNVNSFVKVCYTS